jgi:adenosyl cobinamide kinase/adenosyl cobinamide phosphate guanylyltransferase
MNDDMGKKLELLILTRQEDYQELSNKINQVNKQLNARMDALIERFAELAQKMLFVTNKVNMNVK